MSDKLEYPDLKGAIESAVTDRPAMQWPTFDGSNLDRSKFMTASENSHCSRRIKYRQLADNTLKKKKNYKKRDQWGYFERGHNVEDWAYKLIREGLEGTGWWLDLAGPEQLSFHKGDLAGTPDGLIIKDEGSYESCFVLDIKSIDPLKKVSALPDQDHIEQVIQNCFLVGECWNMDVVGGIVLYINCSNYQIVKQFNFPYDDDAKAIAQTFVEKGARIREAAGPEHLEPEGLVITDGCKYCNFSTKCSNLIMDSKSKRLEDIADGYFTKRA